MNNIVISLIRTAVPSLVGAVLAWVAARGLDLGAATDAAVVAAITGGITAGYFTLIRLLEAKFPWMSVFLGHLAQPVYARPKKA